jgi:hypothetical protein
MSERRPDLIDFLLFWQSKYDEAWAQVEKYIELTKNPTFHAIMLKFDIDNRFQLAELGKSMDEVFESKSKAHSWTSVHVEKLDRLLKTWILARDRFDLMNKYMISPIYSATENLNSIRYKALDAAKANDDLKAPDTPASHYENALRLRIKSWNCAIFDNLTFGFKIWQPTE